MRASIAFDYVDPGSYAAFLLLRGRGDRPPDAHPIRWRPLELRRPGEAPIDAREVQWAGMTDSVLGELRGGGFDVRTPRRIPLTRKAHELACHSRERDRFDRVHRALFEAHFESGRDIGRVDVLVGIGAEAGLEPAEVRAVLGVDRFGPAVDQERANLLEEGVVGVPTVWSARGRIEGFHGWESFRDALGIITKGEVRAGLGRHGESATRET